MFYLPQKLCLSTVTTALLSVRVSLETSAFQMPRKKIHVAIPDAVSFPRKRRWICRDGVFLDKMPLHSKTRLCYSTEEVQIWEKYEMVQLPDSLVSTTIFVGNLCEWVTDAELGELFQSVSSLRSLPACVARKPNASSKKYGFVVFPNVEEKEAAIIRFHGHKLNGRRLKVEEIKSFPGCNRVRVPEKIVAYTVGEAKKTRDGKVNTMRRSSQAEAEPPRRRKQARKKRHSSFSIADRLKGKEQRDFLRAVRNGYITLDGTGFRRGRKGSPLASSHRQLCDDRVMPQIIFCKASGGRPLDNVIVDLSPLRIGALSPNQTVADEHLAKWTLDITKAAEKAGMVLIPEYNEDNSLKLQNGNGLKDENAVDYNSTISVSSDSWAAEPISCLPVISMGVFEGERSNAKVMVKELSSLWETNHELALEEIEDRPKNGRFSEGKWDGPARAKGLSQHRKRRRGTGMF